MIYKTKIKQTKFCNHLTSSKGSLVSIFSLLANAHAFIHPLLKFLLKPVFHLLELKIFSINILIILTSSTIRNKDS